MVDFKKTISENLRKLMEYKEVSPFELASACSLSEERVQSILDEENLMTIDELAIISETYDVTSEFILGFVRFPFPVTLSIEEMEFYRKISNMSNEEIQQFIDSVEKMKDA